jgi:diacylglycerol O-acyltransferase/trehalose O-mycolyltransferase
MTDIQGFFGNKNVNVVSPLGGQFSWYTNWVNDGSKQYQTYMTQELPPLINKQYNANGRNAVGGSYCGFLTPSDPQGAQQVSMTLIGGGQSAENMWGPSAARYGWRTTHRRTWRS